MSSLRLKALRIEQGWTQQQLAEACGLNRTTICAWERGHSVPPDWFWLLAAAAVHGVEPYVPGEAAMRAARHIRRIDSGQAGARRAGGLPIELRSDHAARL